MKKYVFLIKRGIKNEIEVEADNKNEAFNKIVEMMIEERKNDSRNEELDKEIIRYKLVKIIEKNEYGNLETKPYKRDEELVEILDKLDEKDSD